MARRTRIIVLTVIVATVSLAATIIASTVGGNTGTVGGNTGTVGSNTGTVGGNNGSLNLPRIAWEGGPAYWDQFPVAKAAGWGNQDFFPIAIWYDGVSSNAEVRADESYGINTYIGEPPSTNYHFFANNNAFVLTALDNTPPGSTASPGLFLVDEPDGGPTSAIDLNKIRKLVASSPDDGRFKEINFSATVISKFDPAVNRANFEAMMNSYTGPVSVDKYYYTEPSCFDVDYIIVPIDPGHCRTASSYGATVRAVRARLAAGGHLKPVWNFVEDLSGAPDPSHFYAYIQPGQLEGAVMDSIINEARGIIYFNQNFAGTCTGSNVIRQVQISSLTCAQPQMNAMKEVNERIHTLAPAINTQSYQYSFGADLDTMLKTYQGSAYIFAMIGGAASSQPGKRTFMLPPGLARATKVQVLFENRTIPVINGQFTDNFAHEYTYRIYKITM
jgi:hypothetical protein